MLNHHCPVCFDALSDKTRLKVLEIVKKGKKLSVGEIVKSFNLRQPTISYHLDVLQKADLVKSEKQAQRVNYSIENKPGQSPACLKCPAVK